MSSVAQQCINSQKGALGQTVQQHRPTVLQETEPTLRQVRWDRLVAEQVLLTLAGTCCFLNKSSLSTGRCAGAGCVFNKSGSGTAILQGPSLRKERWDGLCSAVDRPVEYTHRLTMVSVDEDSHSINGDDCWTSLACNARHTLDGPTCLKTCVQCYPTRHVSTCWDLLR